ncbi:MAG: putative ABC transport system substrate-binding protein [Planctomycetaceae bacterium]|jgi:putative ABC transport system substrate-binding protein
MKRREFIVLAGGAAATWPLSTRAQSDVPVVGFIVPSPLDAVANNLVGFRKGLGEAGFVEGESVMLELRPGGTGVPLQERADDLVRRVA